MKIVVKLLSFLAFIIAATFAFSHLLPAKPAYPTVLSADPRDIDNIFFVTGEVSGDRLGAWYLKRLHKENPNISCTAIGSTHLQHAGAQILQDVTQESLGVTGISKIISAIPDLYYKYKDISKHILDNDFEHVVLIDSPFINVPLARKLKKAKKEKIRITYIAPPELWIWGTWGIDTMLKRYCDQIIVIYPHEKTWYENQGIHVDYYGYPNYDNLSSYFALSNQKEHQVAVYFGSRKSEIKTTLPLFAKVIKRLHIKHPDMRFIIPLPENTNAQTIDKIKDRLLFEDINLNHILLVQDEKEKHEQVAKSCIGITKPGTMTLVLALLNVPSIIAYKVSTLTYWFSKLFFKVDYVGLPNLILNKYVCPELLQGECTKEKIYKHAENLYQAFLQNTDVYNQKLAAFDELRNILKDQDAQA